MEGKIRLEVVTPYGLVFSDEVDEIVAPGGEGEFGILPNHAPMFATLKIGMLTYKKGNQIGYLFINWGHAEVSNNRVLILADSAERSEDIDVERAMAAKKRAEERLKQAERYDYTRALASLERATTRIQVAEKKRG
ncbi:MAG: F0F1 ATP synthase subunit epsilon [Thermodesulfovibrionia bacterium]